MLTTIVILLGAVTTLTASAATAQIPIGNAPAPDHTGSPSLDDDDDGAAARRSAVHCHYSYCESSTLWCFYWAGVTGYDASLGPLPGETRTSLDTCHPATEGEPAPTVAILPVL